MSEPQNPAYRLARFFSITYGQFWRRYFGDPGSDFRKLYSRVPFRFALLRWTVFWLTPEISAKAPKDAQPFFQSAQAIGNSLMILIH
jgi:hypothetical protein